MTRLKSNCNNIMKSNFVQLIESTIAGLDRDIRDQTRLAQEARIRREAAEMHRSDLQGILDKIKADEVKLNPTPTPPIP